MNVNLLPTDLNQFFQGLCECQQPHGRKGQDRPNQFLAYRDKT